MLDHCADLTECEQLLSAKISEGTTFLGQLDITREDVDKLGRLIAGRLAGHFTRGLRWLEMHVPASLAVFLVGNGIWGYADGDYWSSVATTTGLDRLAQANIQALIGRLFLRFLAKNGLPQCDAPRANRYVAPILLHAGIPDTCIGEFFSGVIVRLVREGITTRGEILDEIDAIRVDHEGNKSLIIQREELKAQERQLPAKLEAVKSFITLRRHLFDLHKKAQLAEDFEDVPDDYATFREERARKISEVRNEIEQSRSRRELSRGRAESFSQLHQGDLEAGPESRELAASQAEVATQRDAPVVREEIEERYRALKAELDLLAREIWGVDWDVERGKSPDNATWDGLMAKCRQFSALQARHSESILDRGKSIRDKARALALMGLAAALGLAGVGTLTLSGNYAAGLIPMGAGAVLLVGAGYRFRKASLAARRCAAVREAVMGQLANVREEIDNCLRWILQVRIDGAIPCIASEDVLRLPMEKLSGKFAKLRQSLGAFEDCSNEKRLLDALRLQEQLDEFDERLRKLGDGDLDAGIRRLEDLRKAKRSLAKLPVEPQRLLNEVSRRLGLSAYKNEEDLVCLCEEIESQLAKLPDLLREKSRQIRANSMAPAYSHLDEPIRRFLVYGGRWAEIWVVELVQLAAQVRSLGQLPQETGSALPQRVVSRFAEWWQAYRRAQASEGVDQESPESVRSDTPGAALNDSEDDAFDDRPFMSRSSSGSSSSNPRIELDPYSGEAKVVIPEIYFPQPEPPGSVAATLRVAEKNGGAWTSDIPLRVYYAPNGLLMTERVEGQLPARPGKYEISLAINGEVKSLPDVAVLDDQIGMAVFAYDGKKLEGRVLPVRGPLWFLVPDGYSVTPSKVVVDDEALSHWEGDYRLLRVDPAGEREVSVAAQDGQTFTFKLPTPKAEPYLSLNGIVSGMRIGDEPVYAGRPPDVVVPIADFGLERWGISIWRDGNEALSHRSFRLNMLACVKAHSDGGTAEIPLSDPELLGEDLLGVYCVCLRCSGLRGTKLFRFAVLPDPFAVIVDRDVYLPRERDAGDIAIAVEVPAGCEMSVNPPARAEKAGAGDYEVFVRPEEDQIAGELTFNLNSEAEISLPFTIELPKVRWRVTGLDDPCLASWSDEVKELAREDWPASQQPRLEIALPPGDWGEAHLILDPGGQTRKGKVRGWVVAFDLSVFRDSLGGGQGAGAFHVVITDSSGEVKCRGPLFRVGPWEVSRAEWTLEDVGDARRLWLEWEENASPRNRVVRLWNAYRPLEPVLVQRVPDGERRICIEASRSSFPAGTYLAQFDIHNPWASSVAHAPVGLGRANIVRVDIDDGCPYIKEWHIRWECNAKTKADKADVSGVVANLDSSRRIKVVLLGMVRGTPVKWEQEGSTDEDGSFSVTVKVVLPASRRADKAGGLGAAQMAREVWLRQAHWLAISLGDQVPAYSIMVLDKPGQLELPFERTIAGKFAALGLDLGVKMYAEKDTIEPQELPEHIAEQLIRALLHGVDEGQVHFGTRTGSGIEKLCWASGFEKVEVRFKSEAVICTTCGKLFPDQAAWHNHNGPEGTCHGFEFNVESSRATLYLAPHLASHYPNVLFSNRDLPLPGGLTCEEAIRELNSFSTLLVEQEISQLGAPLGGVPYDEYQSAERSY